jgi:hypothetical protein
LLCCNHLACTDHFLIKADGDILFQGKSSLITRDLRVTWPRGKSNRKISRSVLNPSNPSKHLTRLCYALHHSLVFNIEHRA